MDDSQQRPDVPRRRQKRPPKKGARRQVAITCPDCGTRFRAALRKEAYCTPCLGCERPIVVTEEAEAARSRETPRTKQAASGRPKRGSNNVFRVAIDTPERPAPERPVLPFLSAIAFPWYPEVLLRWVCLSAGCSAVVFLFVTINWCMSTGGVMARAGYAFGFPFGWLSIWTFSYLAASSTAIITETAGGGDRISGWPEPDWRQWFGEMFQYLPSLAAAVSVAYGVARLTLLLADSFWPAFFASFFLLTPIFMLSAFDSGSALAILTPLVVSSLFRRWWAWLRFYATSAGLAVLWPGTLIYGYSLAPFQTALITGPLMAAVLLIYARLLGRLGLIAAH